MSGRLRAACIHLVGSLVVAGAAGLLVFGAWYPEPFGALSGGRELFTLLVTIDVIVGPLITFLVFNRTKSRTELRQDLTMIGVLQVSALAYGLWTAAVARPVFLVFEVDRLRVVHAVEVPEHLLSQAPSGLRHLPWTGPKMLSVRPFRSPQEEFDATVQALGGVSLSSRPDLWEEYSTASKRILTAARSAAELRNRFPQHASELGTALKQIDRGAEVVYLPVIGRKVYWTALLDPVTAKVLGWVPIDSF